MKNPSARPPARASRIFTLGRRSFAKISAIEGIVLTNGMDEDFREFERKRLPAAERRRILSRKYGKTR
jgi:hypothetical protein